jgi:hypothetical protein
LRGQFNEEDVPGNHHADPQPASKVHAESLMVKQDIDSFAKFDGCHDRGSQVRPGNYQRFNPTLNRQPNGHVDCRQWGFQLGRVSSNGPKEEVAIGSA